MRSKRQFQSFAKFSGNLKYPQGSGVPKTPCLGISLCLCQFNRADGLAAKHFERRHKIQELELASSWILFCCSKCLAARPSAYACMQHTRKADTCFKMPTVNREKCSVCKSIFAAVLSQHSIGTELHPSTFALKAKRKGVIYKNDSSTFFQTFGAIIWVVPLPSSGKWRFGSGLPSLKIECHPGGCILQRGTTQCYHHNNHLKNTAHHFGRLLKLDFLSVIQCFVSWHPSCFLMEMFIRLQSRMQFECNSASTPKLSATRVCEVTMWCPPIDARNCPIICEESICELVLICFPYPIRSMYHIFTLPLP